MFPAFPKNSFQDKSFSRRFILTNEPLAGITIAKGASASTTLLQSQIDNMRTIFTPGFLRKKNSGLLDCKKLHL